MTPDGRIDRTHAWFVIAALASVVLLNIGLLGADPWDFRPGGVYPHGAFGFIVRLADGEWDLGLLRSVAMLAGLLVVALAVAACFVRTWRSWVLVLACVTVVVALVVPAVALQVGLRDATAPWFFTNDSTYQIELAGGIVRDGATPYGHDYVGTGLERFYSLDGTFSPEAAEQHVALRHFAYFPGTPLFAAVWGALPAPWSDVRLLVALATVGLLGAALLFPGPLWGRLALGVAAAANPLVVRNAWFGTADAVTLALLMVAFALALRRRPGWSGAALGAAVLTKQFALVAVPFLVVTLLLTSRSALRRAAVAGAAVVLVGALPFLIADPHAFWDDTVAYGAGTYRIVGYGLSALLLRAGLIEDRNDAYPFFVLALLVWAPITAGLVYAQWHARRAWLGAAGFAASMFVLLFLGRVFHISYLVYPVTAMVIAGLAALAEQERAPSPATPDNRDAVRSA